jgi:hypothetical protein
MRLYLKLILIVATAWTAQTWLQANMEDLDEAQFTFRVFVSQYLPGDSDTQLAAAAERLHQRRLERFFNDADPRYKQLIQTCAAAGP